MYMYIMLDKYVPFISVEHRLGKIEHTVCIMEKRSHFNLISLHTLKKVVKENKYQCVSVEVVGAVSHSSQRLETGQAPAVEVACQSHQKAH